MPYCTSLSAVSVLSFQVLVLIMQPFYRVRVQGPFLPTLLAEKALGLLFTENFFLLQVASYKAFSLKNSIMESVQFFQGVRLLVSVSMVIQSSELIKALAMISNSQVLTGQLTPRRKLRNCSTLTKMRLLFQKDSISIYSLLTNSPSFSSALALCCLSSGMGSLLKSQSLELNAWFWWQSCCSSSWMTASLSLLSLEDMATLLLSGRLYLLSGRSASFSSMSRLCILIFSSILLSKSSSQLSSSTKQSSCSSLLID